MGNVEISITQHTHSCIHASHHGLTTVYTGTVMTSFYYASTPIRGNWFQANQPEHESDDHAGDTVTSVCVTNEKDMALQRQIWSTFVSGVVQ